VMTPRDTTVETDDRVRSHRGPALTGSPAVLDGVVYTGVSGIREEAAAASDSYQCCMFRGSAVAVSAQTGVILWQTYMAPSGYTGLSVWGSNPGQKPMT